MLIELSLSFLLNRATRLEKFHAQDAQILFEQGSKLTSAVLAQENEITTKQQIPWYETWLILLLRRGGTADKDPLIQSVTSDGRPSCPLPEDEDSKLTALIPRSGVVDSERTNPTFWFYIPYSPKQYLHIDFVIQDEDGNNIKQRLIRKSDDLKTPSYLGIELSSDETLLRNRDYQFILELYCSKDKVSNYVSGKFRLLDNAESFTWLDMVDSLMNSSSRESSESDWKKFVSHPQINLTHLPYPRRSFEILEY